VKRLFPFVLAMAGTLIGLAIAFLFTHPDALPSSVRAIDWRRIVGTLPEVPLEIVHVDEVVAV